MRRKPGHHLGAAHRTQVGDHFILATQVSFEILEERDQAFRVAAAGRVRKYNQLRRPSQRKSRAAQTERDFQLRAWIKAGVSPRGSQVRRTEGRWEPPRFRPGRKSRLFGVNRHAKLTLCRHRKMTPLLIDFPRPRALG